MNYLDDLRDVKFNLFEWLPLDKILKAERYGDYERADLEMIVEESLKVAQEVLAPANEEGDRVGARFEDGKVILPPSYHEAYKTVTEAGWVGTTADQEFGGMGLPDVAGTAVMEFFLGANVALTLSMMLGRGTSHLIESFGSDALKARFCEKMNTGEWGGTMCLTEAGAGSDVGASKTKAEEVREGIYKITGEKIFITSGDHDLASNIIHAVLARLPEAPAGTKGLSLFIVPKFRVNADGSLGEPNDVQVGNIEHKLGIHGSPTCSMVFGANGGCEGYLLGQENEGMALMFLMMNAARYEVGLQGLAVASTACQHAIAYAKERLQGKHFKDRTPDGPQVAIVEHPDVRRMLLTQMSYVQAMRALLFFTSSEMDMAKTSEGEEQKRHQGLVEVLTPICKAWCTDWGVKMADLALQCYGGYGYTMDYPAEQYLRDARIAPIYEGTNGIQALDLVFRKFRLNQDSLKQLLARVQETAQEYITDMDLGASAMHVGQALKEFSSIMQDLGKRMDAPLIMLPNAVPILDMFGHLLAGGLLLEQAAMAKKKLKAILREKDVDASDKKAYHTFLSDNAEAKFYHNKVQAAIHFAHRGVPNVLALAVAVRTGESTVYEASF
jgi:alkylation response protein AidB-like acyl-CoA dehydrogenase